MSRNSGEVDPNALQADMDEAVQAVLAKHEKFFLYKWAIVLDTQGDSEDENSRWVWLLHTPDAAVRDVVGLLRHAIKLNDSDLMKAVQNEEDDD